MSAKRNITRNSAETLASIEAPRSASGSFAFCLLMLALCAGGYWYYQYAEKQNEEKRQALADRAAENARIREENARQSQLRHQVAQRRALAQSQEGAGMGFEKKPQQESEAELAAREAKEREAILAAEELERLREQADHEQMLNPYRDTEPEQEPTPKREPNAVVLALSQYDVFNAKPETNADYYIYLCSASWCPHCLKEMPTVVAEYKKMKHSRKVELVLISHDRSLLDAKDFPRKLKLRCPTLWIEDMRHKAFLRLPGFSDDGCGIPHVFMVDKNGKLLMRGHGSIVKDWRRYTVDASKRNKK